MAAISSMEPGSLKGLHHLGVADIEAARAELVGRGVAVGDVSDMGGVKFASFSDPDGNLWLLQEFPPEIKRPGSGADAI